MKPRRASSCTCGAIVSKWPMAATVAVVTSAQSPCWPRVLTKRATPTAVLPPPSRLELGAGTWLGRHGQERQRGGVARRGAGRPPAVSPTPRPRARLRVGCGVSASPRTAPNRNETDALWSFRRTLLNGVAPKPSASRAPVQASGAARAAYPDAILSKRFDKAACQTADHPAGGPPLERHVGFDIKWLAHDW